MDKEKTMKVNAIIYTTLTVSLIIASFTAIYMFRKNRQYKNDLDNQYSKAFYELSDYVNDIETNLNKGMLASSPAQLASISGDIYRLSTSAKSCLGELPTSKIQLDNTAKFLSQVGDYTYVISQGSINGEEISDKQYNELKSLSKYAGDLNASLKKIRDSIENGNVSFVKENKGNVVQAANDVLTDLENVEKSFDEYPSLIYDGPFSEHIENRESPILKYAPETGIDEAREEAAKFMNCDSSELIFEGDTQNSAIEAYNFYIDKDTRTNISVTKKGGYILYFLKDREVKEEKLNFSQAIIKGKEFLNLKGYTSIKNSYYDKSGGIATINYASVQDNVVCYSDLIKIKVALDNGEILGFEANGYLMNHQKRIFSDPLITEQEARNRISNHLDVKSSDLALIPKDSMKEVLCYEYHGSFNGKNFIIYINAQNGREEKILMLIESEEGILTV